MKVSNPQPEAAITGYVQRILVIENYRVTNPFTLPLFANGSPTLLFQTSGGTIDDLPGNNLTLFGQTVFPRTLTIKESFTLIAYFFKPTALYDLFGVSAQELTDNPISLDLLSPGITAALKDKLLNADSTRSRIGLLNNYILSLAVRNKAISQLMMYAVNKISNNTSL
ncbi:MAG TPA: DUF6597 domain-containing transcriptional factor, partial [Anseongella sp.]|nr:DUF6597 domain-containing transcriptional factor [Anseongella sp.]